MFHSAGSMRRVDSRLFCCSTRTLLNHATFSFGRLDAAAFSLDEKHAAVLGNRQLCLLKSKSPALTPPCSVGDVTVL